MHALLAAVMLALPASADAYFDSLEAAFQQARLATDGAREAAEVAAWPVLAPEDLKAGTYALFLELAKEGPWTWVVSNHVGWGSYQYDPKDEVLRVSATPEDVKRAREYAEKGGRVVVAADWRRMFQRGGAISPILQMLCCYPKLTAAPRLIFPKQIKVSLIPGVPIKCSKN